MAETQAPDVVLWVGSQCYPTIDSFITEALTLGCSKRVPTLPADIEPGQSRVFLAHDEGEKGAGRIFGFFVIQGVEVILDDPAKIAKYREEFASLNVTAVSSSAAAKEPARLCGHRPAGAKYLVAGGGASSGMSPEHAMEAAVKAAEPLSDKAEVKGPLVILLQPIPYPRIRFRGWRYMEPEFLEKYAWPQRILPVKRVVRIEEKPRKPGPAPLLGEL